MRIAIAIAGALLLVAASARATGDKPQSTTSGTTSPSTTATTSPSTASPSATGTTASASESAVTGDVKSTDPSAMTITVLLPSGSEQQLNVEKDAKIQRDGNAASFSQLQPGDNVRASLDPKSHKASQIEVKSKATTPAAKDSAQPKPNPSK